MTAPHDDLRALILAGGASSRFFPVNKVFADLTGCGRSMIQQSMDRVVAPLAEGPHARFLRAEQLFVCTGAGFAGPIRAQLELPAANVLVEPARRNTWPAILWTLAHLRRDDPRATVVVLTADHVIGDAACFRRQLIQAAALARGQDTVVTFGIPPQGEAARWTSFGAIRAAGPFTAGVAAIERFEEKPALEQAQRMQAEGGWTWNSGMFVLRIDVAEQALRALQPDMQRVYEALCAAVAKGDDAAARRSFEELPAKVPHPRQPGSLADCSIDYVIMTPLAGNAAAGVSIQVMAAQFPWTDLGHWGALREVVPADAAGNVTIGEVRCDDVRDSTLVAEPGCAVEAVGLRGQVVVCTAEGWVLVVDERAAADIKPLVERVRAGAEQPPFRFESSDCRVTTQDLRVALFRQHDLDVEQRGRTIRVRRRA